jgi:hypothetical protein
MQFPKPERLYLVFGIDRGKNSAPDWEKIVARPLLRLFGMKKFVSIYFVVISLVSLFLAGCASQPQATSTTSQSPLSRNNNNGLASYMH